MSPATQRIVEAVHDEWLRKACDAPEFFEELSRMEMGTAQDYAGRYAFELIQNAADAAAIGGATDARVRFDLLDGEDGRSWLLVANDGAPFAEKDLRAVCRLGKSSKDPRKSIGHKGLGFKSIIEVTSQPFIFSGDFAFGFDRERTAAELAEMIGPAAPAASEVQLLRVPFPSYVADLPTTPRDQTIRLLADGYATVICLPLRVDPSQIERDLLTLDPRLLLFLSDVSVVEFVTGARARTMRRERQGDTDALVVNGTVHSRWFVQNQILAVPFEIRATIEDSSWHDVERVRVAVAIPLDEAQQPAPSQSQPLFVYLPTEATTGLPLALHADLYPDPARKDALEHPYNRWLAQSLAAVVADATVPLAVSRWPMSPDASLLFVPTDKGSGFGATVGTMVSIAIADRPFILLEGGGHAPPGAVLLGPDGADPAGLRDLLGACGASHLLVHRDVEAIPRARAYLVEQGATEITTQTAADMVASQVQENAPAGPIYVFLERWWHRHAQRGILVNALAERRILRCLGGQFARPLDRVFHPRASSDVGAVPAIVPVDVMDPAAYLLPHASDIRHFLSKLGVADYSYREIILKAVLPLFAADSPTLTTEDLYAVFRFLREYWEGSGGSKEIEDRVRQVRVPCYASPEGQRVDEAAADVFFGSEWGSPELERAFGGLDGVYFLSAMDDLASDPVDRRQWREFFAWLGVAERPVVVRHDHPHAASSLMSGHPHRMQWGWSLYLDNIASELECEAHPGSEQRLNESVHLACFSDLVERGEPHRLSALYALLASNWSFYASSLDTLVTCDHGWCKSPLSSRKVPSYLAWALRSAPWLPSTLLGVPEPTPRRPREVWHLGGMAGERVRPYLPALPASLDDEAFTEFRTFVRIVDPTNAAAIDYLALLRALPVAIPAPLLAEPESRDRAKSVFRWISEELAQRLGSKDEGRSLLADPSAAPLVPAALGAALEYRRSSEVFTSTDHALTERWQDICPIVHLGDESGKLREALMVRQLSDVLEQDVTSGTPQPDLSAELERRICDVLPDLIALAQLAPTRARQAIPRLRRMTYVIVDRIVIRETLTGVALPTREFEAAVFLERRTVAQERGGRAVAGVLLVATEAARNNARIAAEIARFLDLERLSDALLYLLTASPSERGEYLRSKGVDAQHLRDVRRELALDEALDDAVDERLRVRLRAELGVRGPLALPSAEPGHSVAGVTTDPVARASPVPTPSTPAAPHLSSRDGSDAASSAEAVPSAIAAVPPAAGVPVAEAVRAAPVVAPPPLAECSPLEPDGLTIDDYDSGAALERPQGASAVGRSGGGGYGGSVDWEQTARQQRADGRRGEEVVFLAERRRLRDAGRLDLAERVVWVSKDDECASYDVESFEIDGTPMIIEVKATSSDSLRFPLSAGEFRVAHKRRRAYYIYRVTQVRSARPQILRVRDPVGLFEADQLNLDIKELVIEIPTQVGRGSVESSE